MNVQLCGDYRASPTQSPAARNQALTTTARFSLSNLSQTLGGKSFKLLFLLVFSNSREWCSKIGLTTIPAQP
jgi:hypothetical protein